MKYPRPIQNLIDLLSTIPTVGHKTAERYAFHLLRRNNDDLQNLAKAITELKNNITVCKNCFAISEKDPCSICSYGQTNKNILCITAGYRDLVSIEATRQYNGLYFILGGTINPVMDHSPAQLNIQPLLNMVKDGSVKEIILALNPDMEGETTSLYLIKQIKQMDIPDLKITRLAKGLPMGADLEYADEITLGNALRYRNEL